MIAIADVNNVKHNALLRKHTGPDVMNNRTFIDKATEASFLCARAEAQICWLEKKGMFLNEIGAEALPEIDKSDLQPFS